MVKPSLALFPELPHESHLRDVYGDKNIDELLSDSDT